MVASAQGEDRSNFQPVTGWGGLDFGFVKATEGTTFKDATFAANWKNLGKGLHARGAYHFFHPAIDPIAQAKFFYDTVKAQGLRPGDMLVADVEILSGGKLMQWVKGLSAKNWPKRQDLRQAPVSLSSVDAAAKAFLDEVARLAGPQNPVLVYTDLSVGATLRSCTHYPLWIAFPSNVPPAHVLPWSKWTFWQWGQSGVDKDAFNGTAADLAKFIASHVTPTFKTVVAHMVTDGTKSLVQLSAELKTGVGGLLQLTIRHSAQPVFDPRLHAYLNAEDLNAPVPAGVTLYHWKQVQVL